MLSEKELETIEQKSRLIDGFDMGIRTPTNEYRLDIKNLLHDLKTYQGALRVMTKKAKEEEFLTLTDIYDIWGGYLE